MVAPWPEDRVAEIFREGRLPSAAHKLDTNNDRPPPSTQARRRRSGARLAKQRERGSLYVLRSQDRTAGASGLAQLSLKASDRFYWIIEVENEAVGLANVTDIDEDYSRCDWAYYLASPTTRNRGVGACVEYLILRFVFDALRLNKLWCEVFRENARVWALHESFGFRREAELRDHVRKDGAFRDVVGLGLLKSDWPEVKARAESRFEAKGLDWRAMSLVDPRDFSVATAGCEPGWKLASRSGRAPPQHVPRP